VKRSLLDQILGKLNGGNGGTGQSGNGLTVTETVRQTITVGGGGGLGGVFNTSGPTVTTTATVTVTQLAVDAGNDVGNMQ
jgi:hypothetical protein